MPEPVKRLGEILIERGKLDQGSLERALRLQQDSGERLGALLVTLGIVAPRDVADALAAQLGIPLLDVAGYPELPILEERVSARFLRDARALPVREDADELVLAMADPTDRYAIEAFEMVTGRRVQPMVAVPGELDAAPILIGHSMGAAVCERMMATRPIRGAALLAPVPPSGLLSVAARLATSNPDYASHFVGLDPMRLSDDILKALRPFYFSDRVDPAILREALFHLKGESPRVLFDLALRLHWAPPRAPSPVFVMGAAGDRISTPDDTKATARHHNVEATILPGMGHMMMLEPEWKDAAQALAEWLATVV